MLPTTDASSAIAHDSAALAQPTDDPPTTLTRTLLLALGFTHKQDIFGKSQNINPLPDTLIQRELFPRDWDTSVKGRIALLQILEIHLELLDLSSVFLHSA